MATINSNGPRKNNVCQTIIGKRQLRANPPIRLLAFLLADALTEVCREVIHSLSDRHVYKDNIWLPERHMADTRRVVRRHRRTVESNEAL